MRILLESNRKDKENSKNYLFDSPHYIIQCHRLAEVANAFAELELAAQKGFWLAGFIAYEAGYAFEKVLLNDKLYDFPLVCFGAYSGPFPPESLPVSPTRNSTPVPSQTKKEYRAKIGKIKKYLAAGETYQVNYTFKHKFNLYGSPYDLYQKLKARQATPYSAFIGSYNFSILSLCPELFFRKSGNRIKVRPMKGTIAPGPGNSRRLKNDRKNRSENLMIVDLLRNDLGKLARPGTVRTTGLFDIEKYKTLYQMTSTIEAEIPAGIKLYDLFKGLFPSGSVTGAPKVRTMQIIRELEKEERGIYTGSIGFISPQKEMVFNVAIRTLLLRPSPIFSRCYHGELGIGSGITYDSDAEEEYRECLLKSRFLG